MPPAVDEPGVGERDESVQGGDRVADVMDDRLEWPESLLLTCEQEPQDEALYTLGRLRQMMGLVGHRSGTRATGQRGRPPTLRLRCAEHASCRLPLLSPAGSTGSRVDGLDAARLDLLGAGDQLGGGEAESCGQASRLP